MKPRTITAIETSTSRLQSVDVSLLAELFDQSPDVAFFVKDHKGRYVVVNDSLAPRHGLKSEAIGKCSRDICPGEFGTADLFTEMSRGLDKKWRFVNRICTRTLRHRIRKAYSP